MLGFVIPTLNRWSAVENLLDSISVAVRDLGTVEVAVVVQGPHARHPVMPERPGVTVTVTDDDGWGASRARNIGLAALPDTVTHVVWPNDHTVYPRTALGPVLARLDHADVIVGQLVERGIDRYTVAGSNDPIDRSNVWDAIEPVTAISTRLIARHGGWSEALGSGASSPWQSSALADLLLRVAPSARVCWEPAFVALGDGFSRGASRTELQAKARAYGRGYGRVLSSWHFSWGRRVGCVVKPLVQRGYRVGPDVLPMGARVAAAVGRAEGLSGRLIPGASDQPRRRRDMIRH